ncbi:MAG TPA: protocatechuate 3,4-dioxygenase subunit alpha [Nocardioidaceae bacterium]|nr:protocatechuate 3,4-dioxygenase subunit alpha [Nocardioidaceae bacterium]
MPEPLAPTPGQTVGPFFGFGLPYERGHELVPPATADSVRLHGTVYDGDGGPVPDALLELRQAAPDGTVPRVEGSLRRDGTVFTGWGRAATDPGGRYSFTTVAPGPTGPGSAAFFALVVFARGLLGRLFTRAYLPGAATDSDPFLAMLTDDERTTLLVEPDADGLRFDVHLQGPRETVFVTFPGRRAR